MSAHTIYVGSRDAMIAEVSADDPTDNGHFTPAESAFIMLPCGDDGSYGQTHYATIEEALGDAKDEADAIASFGDPRPSIIVL